MASTYLEEDRGVDASRAWLHRTELGVTNTRGFDLSLYAEQEELDRHDDGVSAGVSLGWKW